jgi:hypothetical protein
MYSLSDGTAGKKQARIKKEKIILLGSYYYTDYDNRIYKL